MDKTQRCLYDVAKKTSRVDFVNLQLQEEIQTPFLCKMIVHAVCKTKYFDWCVFIFMECISAARTLSSPEKPLSLIRAEV